MIMVSVSVIQIVPVEFNPNSVVVLSLEREGRNAEILVSSFLGASKFVSLLYKDLTSCGVLNLSGKLLEQSLNLVYMLLDTAAK